MPPMPPMPMPPMDVELPMLEVRVRKEDIMELFVPAADADPTVLERERLPLPSKGLGRRDCFFFLLGSLLSVTAVGKPGGRFTFTLGTSTSTSTSADGMMISGAVRDTAVLAVQSPSMYHQFSIWTVFCLASSC